MPRLEAAFPISSEQVLRECRGRPRNRTVLAAKRRSTLPAQAFHTPPRDLLVWASSLMTIFPTSGKWFRMGAKTRRCECVMQGCRALLASGRFTQNPSSLPNGSRTHQWINLAGTSSWPANTGLELGKSQELAARY